VPREFSRSRRIEENLKRLLAELVRREVKDPRVGLVTITAVEVSRDLTHAKIYFTPFAGQGDAAESLQALRHAAGFLRHELRHELRLRVVPELDFRIDESIERGARVSTLIADAVASDERRHVAGSEED
jgi:ribosome-binding factor A